MLVDFMKISTVDYPKKIAATCFSVAAIFRVLFATTQSL